MADLETLKALLERVEKADGFDREIDVELNWLLADETGRGRVNHGTRQMNYGVGDIEDWRDWPGYSALMSMQHYTASVAAAFQLLDHLFPMLVVKFTRTARGQFQITEAWSGDEDGVEIDEFFEPRPPALAILEILLRALISKNEADNG